MSAQKTQIYFSRQYRHLKPNNRERLFFLLMFVLPCLTIFLFFYTKISYGLAIWVKQALSAYIPENSLGIASGDLIPVFGEVYYVQIPSTMPSYHEIIVNLAVSLLLFCLCFLYTKKSKGGNPLSIYLSITLLIHIVSCVFFIFAAELYPYSASQYSELYVKQQVSIWLSFIILSSVVSGILGYGSIAGRLTVVLGTMAYSFVFGCLRYLVFLFFIASLSSLYMATLFFSLGPLFDFLYLVCFYGIYIHSQIKYFAQGEGRLQWQWF